MAKKEGPAVTPPAPELTPEHVARETVAPPVAPPPAEPTTAHRPRAGTRHQLTVAEDGTVQLTADQARAWKDRFDPV